MSGDHNTEVPAGTEIGGYRVVEVAGRGGMGVVYRAQQIDLDRPVALKLIAARLAGDDAFRERFVRESRATAAIDHPNVIPVYSAGDDGGHLFLAMRFVDGEDLRSRVRAHGRLDPEAAAKLTAQIGGALDAAHERGLVHRDVKPANVLLDGDHAYLTDFGLTKRVDGETTMTGSGRWVGTLGYISPEQIRSAPVDARTDVYALGCLLHFMLTGESPYRRDSDEATLYAHLNDPPPDVSQADPTVPPELAAVVSRALSKDPADRFQSAGDLGAAALVAVGAAPARPERQVARGAAAPAGAVQDQTLMAATPTPTPTATPTPAGETLVAPQAEQVDAGRRPLIIAGVVAGVLAIGGLIAALTLGGTHDTPDAPAEPGVTAGRPIKVDPRPNAITYGYGRVWVTSAQTGRLIGIDASGKMPRKELEVNGKITSVAAAFDAIWVTTGVNHQLLRINRRSLKIQKRITLPRSEAVAVVADARWLWVAVRPPGEVVSSVIRVDPRTGSERIEPFGEEGISSLATGGDRVWIPNRRRDRVSTLTPGSLERKSSAQVGSGPRGVDYGKGFAWVTSDSRDTISQVPLSLQNIRVVPSGCRGPIGVSVGDPGIWIACNLSDEVALMRTADLRNPITVSVGSNPFAIASYGNRAWVTNLADGTVTPLTATGF